MKAVPWRKRINEADHEREAAAERLMDAIREELPVGAIVYVDKGRYPFEARITGYSGSWWCDATRIYGENIGTGKTRHFTPSDVLQIITL